MSANTSVTINPQNIGLGLTLKIGSQFSTLPTSVYNENQICHPPSLTVKKKREFNLSLPVSIIEKQEKEIPLPTDGNSQKKKQNVFNFYDNFHEYTVFCDVAMKKCSRENQEDRFSAISPLDIRHNDDAFFAVFDGHGTSVIAETLKEHLHNYIAKNENYPNDIQRAVKESFQQIDEEILRKQKENLICSGGSTALCCLIKEDNLYIINCGDSSSVLVTKDYGVEVLNKLHKPSQKEEQERLISQNTLFTQNRVIGTLAVTRALGDYIHKEYIISEPEITVYKIDVNSKYCLLGTDGFWDIINYETDLPELLRSRDSSDEGPNQSLKDLSTFLVENASNRKTNQKKDNMTLLAIDLDWFYRQNNEPKEDKESDEISRLSSNSFVMCQKSQYKINTEISSFLFQVKSPHSVGRSLNKRSSIQCVSTSKFPPNDGSNLAHTCSNRTKRAFFNAESSDDDNPNHNNSINLTDAFGSAVKQNDLQSDIDTLTFTKESNIIPSLTNSPPYLSSFSLNHQPLLISTENQNPTKQNPSEKQQSLFQF